MYKLSPRVLVGLTALILVGLTGCFSSATSTPTTPVNTTSATRGNVAPSEKTAVNLALPQSGRVTLANANIRQGRISIDQGRQVIVKAGDGSEEPIPFDKLRQVKLDKGAVVYRSGGEIVIRGNNSQATPKSENIEVGWDDFLTVDKKLGLVQVMLSTRKYEGIIAVAQDAQYVVEEIVFDSQQQKMIIRVKAY